MDEVGDLGGRLFPKEKIPTLVKLLEKHGIWLTEGPIGSFDGVRKVMTLPKNPTVLNVRHELSHFFDWQKYGDDYYKLFNQFEREEMVLDRLMRNGWWDKLNDAECSWSLLYPFTRKGGQTW